MWVEGGYAWMHGWMDGWMDGWLRGPWVKRYEWVCLTKSVDERECEGKGVSHYESENNPMICRLLAALIDCLDRVIPGILHFTDYFPSRFED